MSAKRLETSTIYRSLVNSFSLSYMKKATRQLIRQDSLATIKCVKESRMVGQLQDPTHVVPSIIVGLLLSSGWEVGYNDTQDPFIFYTRNPSWTFSTWWDCLSAVIADVSVPK